MEDAVAALNSGLDGVIIADIANSDFDIGLVWTVFEISPGAAGVVANECANAIACFDSRLG